jgi:hypothetical protein
MSISIKDISPDTFDGTRSIRGIVTLRWPYSNSQHALSIQLADENVAKRASRGQVRITFAGKAADALKDVAVMSLLQLSVASDAPKPRFEEIAGTERDIPYKITFTGRVKVCINDKDEMILDSSPVEATITPRKAWHTPELKRTADDMSLTDTWFGQPIDSTKRGRLSFGSSFRYLSSTQGTPSSTPKQTFSDENTPSQTGRSKLSAFTTPSQPAKFDSRGDALTPSLAFESHTRNAALASSQSSWPNSQVEISTPSQPAQIDVQGEGSNIATPLPPRSPVSRFLTQLHPTPPAVYTPPVIVDPEEKEEEFRHASDVSRPSSIHGEFDNTKYETHGTPRSSAYTPGHVHFAFQNNLSAPATPRNVPLLDLASADEQEDLFRKLRASAPPKSDAGSSMVADEDNEEGVLALDTAPSILEKQAQIQEGILRRKISDDPEQQSASHAEVQDQRRAEMVTSTAGDEHERDRSGPAHAPSVTAAYATSMDGRSAREDFDSRSFQEPEPMRRRSASPSMTERGAAVQETIFRSKILDSDGADEGYARSARSIKSSIMVEPRDGRGSIDGSTHQPPGPLPQPHETSLLQQQAAVQESLFREKVEHAEQFETERENPSLAGQPAGGPSSIAGDLVPNRESTLLQQQASVQEDIFREKIDNQELEPPRPASLDHMEIHRSTPLPVIATDSGHGSGTFAGTAGVSTAGHSNLASSLSALHDPYAEHELPGDESEERMLMEEVAVEDQGELIDMLQRDEDYLVEDGPVPVLEHDDSISSEVDEEALMEAVEDEDEEDKMSDEVEQIVEIRVDDDAKPQGMIDAVLDQLVEDIDAPMQDEMSDEVGQIVEIRVDDDAKPQSLIEAVLDELAEENSPSMEGDDEQESSETMEVEVNEDIDEIISIASGDQPSSSENDAMDDSSDSESSAGAEEHQMATDNLQDAPEQVLAQTGLTSPPDSNVSDGGDNAAGEQEQIELDEHADAPVAGDDDGDGQGEEHISVEENNNEQEPDQLVEEQYDAPIDIGSAQELSDADHQDEVRFKDADEPGVKEQEQADSSASPAERVMIVEDLLTEGASRADTSIEDEDEDAELAEPVQGTATAQNEPPVQVSGELTTDVCLHHALNDLETNVRFRFRFTPALHRLGLAKRVI